MTTPFIGSEIGRVRGQWDDGNSTFAVGPGAVNAHRCSQEMNRRLRDRGIEVAELDAPELRRGRGGSRCVTQQIHRDPLS